MGDRLINQADQRQAQENYYNSFERETKKERLENKIRDHKGVEASGRQLFNNLGLDYAE